VRAYVQVRTPAIKMSTRRLAARSPSDALDPEHAKALWARSEELVGERF
jgi:hypothetical protein